MNLFGKVCKGSNRETISAQALEELGFDEGIRVRIVKITFQRYRFR